jgi:L-rhamnose mutarotase
METKAFLARLRPEHKRDYIRAHNNFSAELRAKYQAAGIRQIKLFLLGELLFMYVEADDYDMAHAALAEEPLDQHWQQQVRPMKDADFEALTEIFKLT